jgi:hypothetical protein
MQAKLHQTNWGHGTGLKEHSDHIGLLKVVQFPDDLFFKLRIGYILLPAFIPIIAPKVEDREGEVRQSGDEIILPVYSDTVGTETKVTRRYVYTTSKTLKIQELRDGISLTTYFAPPSPSLCESAPVIVIIITVSLVQPSPRAQKNEAEYVACVSGAGCRTGNDPVKGSSVSHAHYSAFIFAPASSISCTLASFPH